MSGDGRPPIPRRRSSLRLDGTNQPARDPSNRATGVGVVGLREIVVARSEGEYTVDRCALWYCSLCIQRAYLYCVDRREAQCELHPDHCYVYVSRDCVDGSIGMHVALDRFVFLQGLYRLAD